MECNCWEREEEGNHLELTPPSDWAPPPERRTDRRSWLLGRGTRRAITGLLALLCCDLNVGYVCLCV
jgi:hypothetical protein